MIRSVANANAYRIIDSAMHAPVAGADQPEQGQAPAQGQAGGDSISISDEALQALEQDQSQARLEARVAEDPSFAAEMAKSLAYRTDDVAMSRVARQGDGGTYDVRTLPILHTPAETIRLKRIALYEAEVQKGTPPAEIYHKLNQLSSDLAEF